MVSGRFARLAESQGFSVALVVVILPITVAGTGITGM